MDDEEWIIEDPSTAAPEPDSAPADEPSAEPVADTIVDAMEEEEEEVRLPRKDRGDRPILCKYWKRYVSLSFSSDEILKCMFVKFLECSSSFIHEVRHGIWMKVVETGKSILIHFKIVRVDSNSIKI